MRSSAYTVQEMASVMNCSPATVYEYAKLGHLRTMPRLTRKSPLRFSPSEVERLTESVGMGARFDDTRGQWFVDFWVAHPNGRRERIRRDSPVNNRRGANKYEQEVRRAILNGTWQESQPITLNKFYDDFEGWFKAHRKPSVVKGYTSIMKLQLLPFFGAKLLMMIGAGDIEQYKAKRLEEKISKKTINNELAVLSKALHLAEEFGRLDRLVRVKLFSIPRIEDMDYRWLTKDEADKLVAACKGRLKTMVVLALNTGMRLGELEALRWSDINFKAKKLKVARCWAGGEFGTPKSGKAREIALNKTAINALENHVRRIDTELVFCTCRGGPVDKTDLARELKKARKKAKIKHLGWHSLRHTFGTWLAELGVSARTIQELMGHSTLKMTERYMHVSPATFDVAVATLDVAGLRQQLGNEKRGQEKC